MSDHKPGIHGQGIVTTPRRMLKCDYANTELSEYELGDLLRIWAEARGLLDFTPERVHWYTDQENKVFVHFYGKNSLDSERTIFDNN